MITELPIATIIVMLISMAVSLTSSSLNRLLISRFVGWEQYRTMQKETSEHRAQMTQAMRKNDKKLLEKLKKKEPQILNMQKKMVKPQLVLFVLSFSYILIWFIIPLYIQVQYAAYIPGIGGIPVVWWYFICSFLFGTLSSRLLGIMPIE
ncbi:MAG: EMC3/TMCO1 family protein [Candidatus Bathyarchaeia archaeon]